MLQQSAFMCDEAKEKIFRYSVGYFFELENMLYTCINIMCRVNLQLHQVYQF